MIPHTFTYRLLLFSIWFFAFSANGFSQIYDVFSHEEIDVSNYVVEVQPTQDFVRAPFDIVYLSINNPKNKAEIAINEATLPLCKKFVEDENEYLRLLAQLKSRKSVLNAINQSRNDLENYREIPETSIPKLLGIDCEAISLVANQLFFAVAIEFEIEKVSRYDKQTITLRHYYIADMQTGIIKPHKNTYSQKTLDDVLRILNKPLNDQYKLVTTKLNLSEISQMDQYDEEYDEPIDTTTCEDICPKILLGEADFLWYPGGIVVRFQDYTETSKIYNGSAFQLFLNFQQSQEIAKILPDFQFVNKLKVKPTLFRNYNLFNRSARLHIGQRLPEIDQIIENIEVDRPKKVTTLLYQEFQNRERSLRGKQIDTYNESGLKTQRLFYDSNEKLNSTSNYTYNSDGNLLEEQSLNADNISEKVVAYEYDKNGNLTLRREEESDDIYEHYFFYNGNYMYMLRTTALGDLNNNTSRVAQSGETLEMHDYTAKIDERGKMLGVTSSARMMQQTQIGYDADGKLTEIHREYDRYQYYFEYDDLDRLSRWLAFDGSKLSQSFEYKYESSSLLPYQSTKISSNGQTILVDEYEWEF